MLKVPVSTGISSINFYLMSLQTKVAQPEHQNPETHTLVMAVMAMLEGTQALDQQVPLSEEMSSITVVPSTIKAPTAVSRYLI